MKRIFRPFIFGITPVLLLLGLWEGKDVRTSTIRLENPPVYHKGTYWKYQIEQLTDYTGKKIDHKVNAGCFIDGETNYKGVDVYEATWVIYEESKVSKLFIEKANLRLLDGVSVKKEYTNETDTVAYDFELLNFPLYPGKKWRAACRFQEFPGDPVDEFDLNFEVVSARDTSFHVGSLEISTQAFFIEVEAERDSKTYRNGFVYFAPNKDFPGSCPVLLLWQLLKEPRIPRRYTITDFYW